MPHVESEGQMGFRVVIAKMNVTESLTPSTHALVRHAAGCNAMQTSGYSSLPRYLLFVMCDRVSDAHSCRVW